MNRPCCRVSLPLQAAVARLDESQLNIIVSSAVACMFETPLVWTPYFEAAEICAIALAAGLTPCSCGATVDTVRFYGPACPENPDLDAMVRWALQTSIMSMYFDPKWLEGAMYAWSMVLRHKSDDFDVGKIPALYLAWSVQRYYFSFVTDDRKHAFKNDPYYDAVSPHPARPSHLPLCWPTLPGLLTCRRAGPPNAADALGRAHRWRVDAGQRRQND